MAASARVAKPVRYATSVNGVNSDSPNLIKRKDDPHIPATPRKAQNAFESAI
jgi:hypothetical protein